MGRRHHYRPGDWYVTDDRTGFTEPASRCRKQWDGQIVSSRVFDSRHPQESVRGVRDYQAVPDARPQPPPVFGGPVYEPLASSAAIQATTLTVSDATGLVAGNRFGLMLDSGVMFTTKLLSISGSTLILRDGLPCTASAGNLVCDYGVPG